ncbi:YbaN family protein [Peptoniphilus asaccharolyticus]
MKTIYIILGFIFLGLGLIGIYLPLLPTTPFLLLATACFARGSEKFNKWFLQTSIYKNNIEPLKNKEGMTIKKKLKIMSMITLFLSISFILMHNLHGRICLIIVFLAHCYYFFMRVKTIE